MRVSLNGKLLDEREALVSAFDRGFLYGDGIFESMRAVNGTVFRLERHLRRLTRSASLIGLDLEHAGAGIASAVREVLTANGLENARIRVTVTRGPGRPGPAGRWRLAATRLGLRAFNDSSRKYSNALPVNLFVPDFVTTFITAPAARPNSAEKPLVLT